jgi:hypothetical protein
MVKRELSVRYKDAEKAIRENKDLKEDERKERLEKMWKYYHKKYERLMKRKLGECGPYMDWRYFEHPPVYVPVTTIQQRRTCVRTFLHADHWRLLPKRVLVKICVHVLYDDPIPMCLCASSIWSPKYSRMAWIEPQRAKSCVYDKTEEQYNPYEKIRQSPSFDDTLMLIHIMPSPERVSPLMGMDFEDPDALMPYDKALAGHCKRLRMHPDPTHQVYLVNMFWKSSAKPVSFQIWYVDQYPTLEDARAKVANGCHPDINFIIECKDWESYFDGNRNRMYVMYVHKGNLAFEVHPHDTLVKMSK